MAARDFKISYAAWSCHRAVFGGTIKMLDVPKMIRQEFDIDGLELVSTMLDDHTSSFSEMKPSLDKLQKNAQDNNVSILLTMVDEEGDIGAPTKEKRDEAVKRHKKWLDICEYLGCHSMRMNWRGHDGGNSPTPQQLEDFIRRSAPGFRALCEYGDQKNLCVIIENHGGPSSDPALVDRLMAAVSHPGFGTLPDFGNFPPGTDIYAAIDSLMKHAHKAVSAKCTEFDDATGLESTMDYPRIIDLVVDKHNYHGYIGIEYEGSRLSETEGVKRCKALLERLRA